MAKRICVIGAGPSGLLSVRHLKEVGDVTCYDGKADIGGVWLYNEKSELYDTDYKDDEFYKLYGDLPDSQYKGLVTNLPKYMMQYKDFPYKPDDTLF